MIFSEGIRSVRIGSPKALCIALVLLGYSILLVSMALGQGGVATGDLRITVKDPKGNLVANATVTVGDVAKGLERTATGDGQGGYSAITSAGRLYRYRGSAGLWQSRG